LASAWNFIFLFSLKSLAWKKNEKKKGRRALIRKSNNSDDGTA